MINKRGYFGIGILQGKFEVNYGTLYRTAKILGANFAFIIGKRFKKQASDTLKSWRHLPLFEYATFEDFYQHIPYSCQLVGIELNDDAMPIKNYVHPQQACYLLGAEDHGLPDKITRLCPELICLPGATSMNVSVAGSIVLYDRINKY